MIEKLVLTNFQSHEKTILDFHPGVNYLIGPSGNGKTAILRAINWVVNNRPSGDGVVSHWNQKLDAETSVLLVKDNQKIKRIKTKARNGYDFNNIEMSAVGTDVPQKVQDAINFTEINIQKQMDAPFLLSESPGEIAKFFNKIIKLDEVDRYFKAVESLKRESKKKREEANVKAADLTKKLKEMDWIEKVETQINKAIELETTIDQNKDKAAQLQSIVANLETVEKEVETLLFRTKLEAKVKKALSSAAEIEIFRNQIKDMVTILADIDFNEQLIKKYQQYNIPVLEEKLGKCFLMLPEIQESKKKIERIASFVKDLERFEQKLETLSIFPTDKIEQGIKLAEKVTSYSKKRDDLATLLSQLETCVAKMDENEAKLQRRVMKLDKLKAEMKVCPTCGKEF